MQKFIQKLRAKPEKERQQILHVATFISGILLITLWSFTLNSNFRDPDLQVKAQQDLQPFKDLTANVIDGYNVISDEEVAPDAQVNSLE